MFMFPLSPDLNSGLTVASFHILGYDQERMFLFIIHTRFGVIMLSDMLRTSGHMLSKEDDVLTFKFDNEYMRCAHKRQKMPEDHWYCKRSPGIWSIMLTCPCIVYPLTPHFYIVRLGFTGVYIFLIFALKHRLWVLVRTASVRRF